MSGLFIAIGGLGTPELIVILVIVVVIFGAGKLTDVGKQIGSGIREFKAEMSNDSNDKKTAALEDESATEVHAEPRDVTDEHKNRS